MLCRKKNATVQKSLMTEHFTEDYLLRVLCVLRDLNTIHKGASLHKQGKAAGWAFTAVFSLLFLPPFAKGESGKFFHTEDALDTELRST